MTPPVKDDRYPHLVETDNGLQLNHEGQSAPEDLPLVLCGPILRRVTWGSVTVWIALQEEPDSISLELYEGTGGTQPINDGWMTENEPLELGDNLYVAAVTEPDVTPDRDQLYTYDLAIEFGDDVKRLGDQDVLRPGTSGYEPIHAEGRDERPSFVYPPKSPDDLRLFYGSCRKPHGKGKGGMRAVTEAMTNDIDYDLETPKSRPHLLVLGGDQIYADDVADQFHAMLWNYGDALLGTEEEIYDSGDPDDEDATPSNSELKTFRPDHRQKVTVDRAELSAANGYGTSHLYGFGEFMAMYLCVWSDVLWPAADELEDALPSKFELCHVPDDGSLEIVLPDRWSDERREEYTSPEAAEQSPPNETWFKDVFEDKHEEHEKETSLLQSFREDLPAVRRALANVPTIMMWDDHDVTDDWFINGRWVADVLGNEMGHQIVHNGMAAAIVCQLWGNQPEQFSKEGSDPDEPGDFLQHLKKLPVKDESPPGDDEESEDEWFYETLGIPSKQEAAAEEVLTPQHEDSWNRTSDNYRERFNYHFGLCYGEYGIGALDTRTWRGYPDLDPDGAAEVLSIDGQAVQLSDIEANIVDQIFHNPSMDRDYESFPRDFPLVIQNAVPLWPVQEASLGQEFKYAKERFSDELPEVEGNDGISATEYGDYEHWRMQRGAMENLVSSLAGLSEYIVTLSGDVHTGYTSRTEYWHHYDGGPAQKLSARFANLTSSPSKNEDRRTRAIHQPGHVLDSAVGIGGWYHFDAPFSVRFAEDVANVRFPYRFWQSAKDIKDRYLIKTEDSWTDSLPTFLEEAIRGLIIDEHSTTLTEGTEPHLMSMRYLIKGRDVDTEGVGRAILIQFERNVPDDLSEGAADEEIDYMLRVPVVVPNGPITEDQLLKQYQEGIVRVEFRRGDLIVDPEVWLLPDDWKATLNLPDQDTLEQWWTQHIRPTWNAAAEETPNWIVPDKWAIDPDQSWVPTIQGFAEGLAMGLKIPVDMIGLVIRQLQAGGKPHWEYRVDYLRGEQTGMSRTDVLTGENVPKQEKARFRDYINHNFGKEVVGRCNFGEVRFDWSNQSKTVKHWLWWRMNGTHDVLPWTEWSIDMTADRDQPSELVENTVYDW